MNARARQWLILCVVIAVALMATSCSSGPPAPAKGTPAFYWSAAKETFAGGDYVKANDHLDQLCRIDNEYTVRAQPWKLVLDIGMAKGYLDLADRFEYGARANRANPAPFRKQMSQYRIFAGQLALQAGETFHKFRDKSKDANIALEFSYPTGSAAEIPQLSKIGQGILVQASEIEDIEKRMMHRSVLMATCSAVGAPEDTAKTQEMFKTGRVEVPRDVFMLAMAGSLYELSKIYARDKLDQPQRLQVLCNEALEALQAVPESKQTKDLKAKIEKALKQAKLT